MKTHVIATLAALGIAAFAAACSNSDDDVSQSESNITEWATTVPKDNAYGTKYVISAVCEKIYGHGSAAQTCKEDHDFRLIESKYSTKYGYLKAIEDDIKSAIEVGQTLQVTAPTGTVYQAKLLRQLDEAFHLRWSVLDVESEGGGPPPIDVHDHIANVADDLGEYVDLTGHEDVRVTTWEALPEVIQLECEADMLARAEMNSEGDHCSGTADWSDPAFGEILFQGQTVGYVCGYEDILFNCSLHDGSGVWLYLDEAGEEVTETEWTG